MRLSPAAGGGWGPTLCAGPRASGWAVAIHYRSSSKEADALATEIKAGGGRAVTVGADLGALDDFADMFGRANAGWGFCSLLVNSASTFEYDDIATISRANLEKLFAVNLNAPMLLARDFAAQLRDGAGGLIVNVLDQN